MDTVVPTGRLTAGGLVQADWPGVLATTDAKPPWVPPVVLARVAVQPKSKVVPASAALLLVSSLQISSWPRWVSLMKSTMVMVDVVALATMLATAVWLVRLTGPSVPALPGSRVTLPR